MIVSESHTIEEIEGDGSRYTGNIEIGGTCFNVEFEFLVSLKQLRKRFGKRGPRKEAMHRYLRLRIAKNGSNIELEDTEFHFFRCLILPEVLLLHDVRANWGDWFVRKGPLSIGGATSLNMAEPFCAMLSTPKFGCRFIS